MAKRRGRARKGNHELFHIPTNWDDLKKTWDGLYHGDWLDVAIKQKSLFQKELTRLSYEIIHTIQSAHFLAGRDKLLKEARHSLDEIIRKARRSEIVTRVKSEVLSLFNIPSRKDIQTLNVRLSQLEKRLTNLGPTRR